MIDIQKLKGKNMKKLKIGIIGMGFIGLAHLEALRRIGFVELEAVADSNIENAIKKGKEYGINKCYGNIDDLINDPEIIAIHNCTPNHMHKEINEKIIRAGKHVFSEKPLARSSDESLQMVELLKQYPDTIAGINFCYRMNSLVQDAKNRICANEIGKPYIVYGNYMQDWLLYDTDYNWRVEPEYTGVSRCVGDIGSHWIDTAQTLIGSRIVEVCSNTVIAMPIRKKPTVEVETFSTNTNTEYEEKIIVTEDYAGVLVKFENGVSGLFQCSEISAGRKCYLEISIDGSKASFHWEQETSDRMWKGNRDSNNEEIMRNPNLMTPEARKYTYLAAGHPEGWNDALKNNFMAFYTFIRDGKRLGIDEADFATFEEGHYIMKITEAIIKSGQEHRWIKVE